MATPPKQFSSVRLHTEMRWSLPSLSSLLLFGLVIPAAIALSNQWLLERHWILNRNSNLSWHHYALYPWMALSAAAASWSAGRYLYPAFLRCIVFVWCLVLLDLLTFMASLGSTHDSQFGYMLVSAQINLLILWTILGSGGWQWRLPMMLAVTPLVVLLGSSIGSTWWLASRYWYNGNGWFSQSWQRVVLLAAIVAALLCAALRWPGFSLQPRQYTAPDANSQSLRVSQFGVRHMLIWSAAIVPLLLIARSLDFLFITKFRQNELFPITLLAVSLATVSLTAIWVVLGAGKWYLRFPFILHAPLLTTAALEGYSLYVRSQFGPLFQLQTSYCRSLHRNGRQLVRLDLARNRAPGRPAPLPASQWLSLRSKRARTSVHGCDSTATKRALPSFATDRVPHWPIPKIVPFHSGSRAHVLFRMRCAGRRQILLVVWQTACPRRVAVRPSPTSDVEIVPPCDWTELTDCQSLVAIPEVRERIARYAAKAKKRFTGEDFLEVCDKVFAPVSGGVPLTLIAKIAQPLAERLGFKSVKTRSERTVDRPGVVIVAILCSLAQNNQQIREATAESNGCTITTALPSDIWSLKTDLVVSVRTESQFTIVEACVTIPGQKYDWGKCNRVLDHLFDDLLQLTAAA